MTRRWAIASPAPRVAPLLWLLLFAFAGRVVGQLLVAVSGVTWLPPMEAWMSGLLPYPWLLLSQVVIILLAGKICLDFSRGSGWCVRTRPAFARGVFAFACLYLAAMLVRLAVSFHPAAAWLGDRIPIAFHVVLASFLLVFSLWHRGRT